MRERMREEGIEPPVGEDEAPPEEPEFGTPDDEITTWVDVSLVYERKEKALRAHASQVAENSWFLQMPEEVRRIAFGAESFVRVQDRTGATTPETDLFAGLR